MVPTLQECCLVFLVVNFKKYKFESLALLPLHLRRALSTILPPVHLSSLENTPFMDSIDSTLVWKSHLQNLESSLSNLMGLTDHNVKLCSIIILEKFASSLFSRVIEHRAVIGRQLPAGVCMLSLPVSSLSDGMLSILKNNSSSLVNIDKGVLVPNYEPLKPFQLINQFIRFDIQLTTVNCNLGLLPIDISKQLQVGIKQLFSVSHINSLTLVCKLCYFEHIHLITSMLEGLAAANNGDKLKKLALLGISMHQLEVIQHHLTHSFTKLVEFDISLRPSQEAGLENLLAITCNKTSLQQLRLSLKRFFLGNMAKSFSIQISEMFSQLHSMKLVGPCDIDLYQVISSFLCCNSKTFCELELLSFNITENSALQTYPLPDKENLMINGPKKSILFSRINFPSSFFEWLFTVENITLRKLSFFVCKVVDLPNITIKNYFEDHCHYSIKYFNEV